jgi:ketosteroid isomerase-like protein
MAEENVETARRILEGWAKGDFAAGVAAFAPHAVLVVSPDFAEWGVFVGEDQIRDYTLRFMEQYDGPVTIEPTGLREAGDTVLASVVQHGRGRTSGIDIELPYFVLMTFRGGKIVRMESILDEAEATEAAGLAAT